MHSFQRVAENFDRVENRWFGPSAWRRWEASRKSRGLSASLDVALLTHPRDEADIPRLFPWATALTFEQRLELIYGCRPAFGEVIEFFGGTAGLLFLPLLASDLMDPERRAMCRRVVEDEALPIAARAGVRSMCLGGLSGALTGYGRKIVEQTDAAGIKLTTGHALTAISVVKLYEQALKQLRWEGAAPVVSIVGLGSVGLAVARLLAGNAGRRPSRLSLVDTTTRRSRLEAGRLELDALLPTVAEVVLPGAKLPADCLCYDADVIISAVSTPYVLDIGSVRPGTILIDDSQPYCWSRDDAWQRVAHAGDIMPCDAGLIDCSAIGFSAHFPFDFVDHGANGSRTTWSCLGEGLLRLLWPDLPPVIGEPEPEVVDQYAAAFESSGFAIPLLQCGPHALPVAPLRERFAALRAQVQ